MPSYFFFHISCFHEQSTLIKNGIVTNAESSYVADVLIHGDKIVQIGKNLKAPIGSRVIDASGKFVMPGGIDPHVHMEVRACFFYS